MNPVDTETSNNCDLSYCTLPDLEPIATPPHVKQRFLPSEEDKIRESVDVGSVFLAMDANFFTPKALLQWLTTVPVNERRQVAYKAVCTKIPPNQQYLDDTFHFLTKKPEYTSIAVGFGLVVEIPDQNTDGAMNPVLAHVCEALISINSDANLRKLSALILAGQGSAAYLQANLATCCRARNFPHLRNLSGHEYNMALVAADWTAKFRYNEKLTSLIIHRVTELQKEAPIYYSGVAYKGYHKVAVKLNKDKLLTQLSRDELITFNTFFPNVIDQKVLGYSDLAYKIALLGNDVAGYVLGFPVQNHIPNEDQIHQAIQILTEQGADKYAEQIKQYVVSTYTPALPFEQKQRVTYSNDTDVIMEDIDNYAPFDIISYQTGSHMYRFTRSEFDKLSESKKNPWTNDWLPPTVLSTIRARTEAAKELGLPPARPLREMLTRIEDGTLFQSDTAPKPTPQPSQQRSQASPADILSVLMSTAVMGQWAPGLPPDFDDGIEIEFQGNVPQGMIPVSFISPGPLHPNMPPSVSNRVAIPNSGTTMSSPLNFDSIITIESGGGDSEESEYNGMPGLEDDQDMNSS